jgi:hypothetical protein
MAKVIRFPTEDCRASDFGSLVLEVPVAMSEAARGDIRGLLRNMFGTDAVACVADGDPLWSEDDPVGYVVVNGDVFPILDFSLELSEA